MQGVLELTIWFVLLWVASVVVSYGLTRARHQRTPRKPELIPGASWKIRALNGVYRVRLIEESPLGYRVSAPLSQDVYVPLRPGETVHVETAGEESSITFRTAILSRDPESHEFLIALPSDFVVRERRESPRKVFEDERPVQLNGQPSVLLNLSPDGAKLRTRAVVEAGDWVRVDLPDRTEQMACVLEVLPDTLDGRPASGVRLIFAEPS